MTQKRENTENRRLKNEEGGRQRGSEWQTHIVTDSHADKLTYTNRTTDINKQMLKLVHICNVTLDLVKHTMEINVSHSLNITTTRKWRK